jgi:hypothetical protein
MPRIDDGKGKNIQAGVSYEQRLQSESVNLTPQCYASLKYGNAYQVVSGIRQVTPAGTYGLLALTNTGSDPFAVTYIRVGIDKTETVQAKVEILLGGTWSSGSDASLYNMDQRNSEGPSADYDYNTVISGADVIDNQWAKGPDELVYNKEGSIILKRGAIISIKVTTTTDLVNIHGRISFYVIPKVVADNF